MAQDTTDRQDSGMDRIAALEDSRRRLEEQIAASKEQRESVEELRAQYMGFVDEVRKLRGALRLVGDILSGPDDWSGSRRTEAQRIALAYDVVQRALERP